MKRLVALFCALASVPAGAQTRSELAEVGAALIAGDSSRAYQIARDGSRLRPDDVGLLRARLRLEMAGYGTEVLASRVRNLQITDVARRLLRRSPGDTLALRALSTEALWTVLQKSQRVTPVAAQAGGTPRLALGTPAEFVSPEEIRARTNRSFFDLDARDDVLPSVDASAPARKAREDLEAWLPAWRASAPADPMSYIVALTVAAFDADWEAALGEARAYRSARPRDPAPLLYLGLAHARLGNADAAEAAFDEALRQFPASRRDRYTDLAPLLTPVDQELYRTHPGEFADLYWSQMDPRLLTAANERRVEHVARVVEADLLFGPSHPNLFQYGPGSLRGAEKRSGQIWVRYGRPGRSASFPGSRPFTSLYVFEYGAFRYVFVDDWGTGEYDFFAPGADAYSGHRGTTAANDDYVMQDRQFRRENPSQTQVAPTFALPILASRFRQPGGGTEVVVAYGVPLADAAAVPDEVESGVFSVSGSAEIKAVRRTVRPSAGRVLTGNDGAVWPDAATVALPSVRATVRAEVKVGEAWGAGRATLDPLPTSGFGLSDVLLASAISEDGGGPVVRDGLAITPVPWGVFGVGDPLYVYVETYGLTLVDGRTSYSVEAQLVPEAKRDGLLGQILGRGQRPGVAVRNDPEGDRATESTSFFIDASGQAPGRYTLRIEVTDRATGEAASSERAVILE